MLKIPQTPPAAVPPPEIFGRARSFALQGAVVLLLALSFGAHAGAQETASVVIDADCNSFALATDGSLAYTVPHMKGFEKLNLERDELWISSPKGKARRILEPDKFMPVPPPVTYAVQSMIWSPDSHRLAVSMVTKQYPYTPKVKGKKKGDLDDFDEDIDNTDEGRRGPAPTGSGSVLALFDDDGREIKVAGSKTRFIEGVSSGIWLGDEKTVAYMNNSGQIARVTPDDGKTATLFDGKHFQAVAWDPVRSRAFAVGEGLSLTGRLALVELDLANETVREVARLDAFQGALTVSPMGTVVGFFRDGDTVEVRSVANPAKIQRARVGFGRFEFDRDDRRILIKRGPPDKSNDLVWVRLDDGTFTPILHDLVYRDFHISPDGKSLGVAEVGRGGLHIYPLE